MKDKRNIGRFILKTLQNFGGVKKDYMNETL